MIFIFVCFLISIFGDMHWYVIL